MSLSSFLPALPSGLRDPLIAEYGSIVHNFLHRKWQPAELSGGLFSEIVYTILEGYATGSYANAPSKPKSMVDACKALESKITSPRSFQILIPRILPVLYEVRNNRSVGHVGGDVDPNHMDAAAVLSNASWVMAELVRKYHNTTIANATALVEGLVERKVPLVWTSGDTKRVIKQLPLPSEILVLLAVSSGAQSTVDLIRWTEISNSKYFNTQLSKLHAGRFLTWNKSSNLVELMPAGLARAEKLISKA